MMNMAKQDILSVLCNRSNEGLCHEKWIMADLTCSTVAIILYPHCLIVISPILERNKHPFACLLLLCGMPVSHIYKHFGQACWFLVLYLFDRQDKNVILII